MATLDHWHPVLEVKHLGAKPQGIRIDGQELVLFRTSDGAIGALDNCCPHRRMRLSLGSVVGNKLQCTYHGWTYDCRGAGESPGTPKLHATVGCYDTREAHGWIWVKQAQSSAEFPEFQVAGYRPVSTLVHEIEAPLEIVLDNFTEVEHTPTTHALLGYELSRMTEVETRVDATESTVRVFNGGPQKRISPFVAFLFGIQSGDYFVDDWTTRFSPVYACYDQYWSDAHTRQEKGVRWRIYVFFNPIHDQCTQLVTFPFIRPDASGGWRNWFLFDSSLKWLIDREITLDKHMVESLADKRPGIEGMKLSRFDKVLGLQRERINRIYRGINGAAMEESPAEALA